MISFSFPFPLSPCFGAIGFPPLPFSPSNEWLDEKYFLNQGGVFFFLFSFSSDAIKCTRTSPLSPSFPLEKLCPSSLLPSRFRGEPKRRILSLFLSFLMKRVQDAFLFSCSRKSGSAVSLSRRVSFFPPPFSACSLFLFPLDAGSSFLSGRTRVKLILPGLPVQASLLSSFR